MNINAKPVVLLVEDEKTLASIIADTLNDEGFSTLTAFDGNEGLRLFLEKRPDILIADVMLPLMDGFRMVGKIRGMDKTTPILFLTARSSTEDLVSGFEIGANDYLRKPFKMQELISLLLELWNDDSQYNLNSLHGYIHKLRKFLRKDETVRIINERGIGYKIVARQ